MGSTTGIETERKWVITRPLHSLLADLDGLPGLDIARLIHVYPTDEPGVRYGQKQRPEGDIVGYAKTTKTPLRPGSRTESIDGNLHPALWATYIGQAIFGHHPLIIKTRYTWEHHERTWELDVFEHPTSWRAVPVLEALVGLRPVLLEVEGVEPHEHVDLPEFLRFCASDVTTDERFINANLATRFGVSQ